MPSTSSVQDLSYTRVRYGRGFRYLDESGEPIRDTKTLRRIRKLVIPPMWKQVYICSCPNGKVQATGRDLKQRKQYIYHADWEQQRQAEKFAKLAGFGRQLPAFRAKCTQAVQQQGWPREKVLSLMILILDETGIRIGNQQYANRNGTYGLSTLRRKHLQLEDEQTLVFSYRGKSGKDREVTIADETLTHFIRRAAEQPGYEIFRYRDATTTKWQDVDSEELNDFIHQQLGQEYSSKYFRTWVAGRLAVELYPTAIEQTNENSRKQLLPTLIRLVADELGNTPSVCRNYYLHPRLIEAVRQRKLPLLPPASKVETQHEAAEKVLLSIIMQDPLPGPA
ncbi:MAG: DNA topoisomerase IB [Bacteroidota bacterium]